MTDQEFRDFRSMVERRVREARAFRQGRRIAPFVKKPFYGVTDRQAQSSAIDGPRDPQVLRKS
jgi:hypothetical protein